MFRVVAKPNVGPFEVDQKAQWFKFARGGVAPVSDEELKAAKDAQEAKDAKDVKEVKT